MNGEESGNFRPLPGGTMTTATALTQKRCQPCEGGVPPLTPEQVREHLQATPGWTLTADGQRIRREWTARDFTAALDFFAKVGQLAEEEGHHPDLHLTRYRQVAIELWTHAVGGLSENDFILAAKIDQVPIELKK
jgi:4a-hydroxytetrahydrobiopterin dehydratase